MEYTENYRFRSDFYHDLKLQKEFNRASIEGNLYYRGMYLVITGIFLWFFWQMVIVLKVPVEYAKHLPGIVAIWLVVELVRFIAFRGGGIHFKRSLMLNGGKPVHDSVFFCEDAIYTAEQETGNKCTIQYDTIRIVYESDNLYLLGMKYGVFLMVDKNSLTASKEEFGQFLFEKCPKLRKKKVRKCRTGRVIHYIKWTVIMLSLLFAVFFHPWLQINKRLQGQIHNGMSLSEISLELEQLGLKSMSETELSDMESGLFYLSDDKLTHLLYCMGAPDRDYDTGTYRPRETGVFFSYYWSEDPDTMYTDLLQGIAAMSRGELVIENIQEDHSKTNWEIREGTIRVDFTLNGTAQTLDAVFYGEWYDEQTFNMLSEMIRQSTGKQLYFSDFERTACFIFFGDDAWAKGFSEQTGLILSGNINDIY